MASRVSVKIGMDAGDVKDALRKRHPAFEPGYQGVGRWVTLEEWEAIDLLALDAWRSAQVIGYEVKISRSDMRSELLDRSKRRKAVGMCTRFYFAVPVGMLTDHEIAYREPEWEPSDFVRQTCTNPDCHAKNYVNGRARGWMKSQPKPRGSRLRGTEKEGVTLHLGHGRDVGVLPGGGTYSQGYEVTACCNVCKGYGTIDKCVVERDAPTLWVPQDVGLIEVDGRGCSVIKEAPLNKLPEPIVPAPYIARDSRGVASVDDENLNRMNRQAINALVRWTSFRPDPRHRPSYPDTVET